MLWGPAAHTLPYKPLLFSNILCMSWIDHSYGFGQVPENWRVLQVQSWRGVVTEDPGELRRNKKNEEKFNYNMTPPHLYWWRDHIRGDGVDLPQDTATGRCKCAQRWCSAASDTQSWRFLCRPISVQHIDITLVHYRKWHSCHNSYKEKTGFNKNLCEPRCLQ